MIIPQLLCRACHVQMSAQGKLSASRSIIIEEMYTTVARPPCNLDLGEAVQQPCACTLETESCIASAVKRKSVPHMGARMTLCSNDADGRCNICRSPRALPLQRLPLQRAWRDQARLLLLAPNLPGLPPARGEKYIQLLIFAYFFRHSSPYQEYPVLSCGKRGCPVE